MAKQKMVKIQKITKKGNPVQKDGEEVFNMVTPEVADNLVQNSKLWKIVDDPRKSTTGAKPSGKKDSAKTDEEEGSK